MTTSSLHALTLDSIDTLFIMLVSVSVLVTGMVPIHLVVDVGVGCGYMVIIRLAVPLLAHLLFGRETGFFCVALVSRVLLLLCLTLKEIMHWHIRLDAE